MPSMPSGPLADTFSALLEGLAADCERIANQRENDLRNDNARLLREIEDLKKNTGEAVFDVTNGQETSPKKNNVDGKDAPGYPSTDSKGNADGEIAEANKGAQGTQGVFDFVPDAWPSSVMGNMRLPDDFWTTSSARDASDTAGAEDDGDDILLPIRKSCVLDPSSKRKLTWDVLGIPILAWDLITIPMQGFPIGDTPLVKAMDWVTLIYWTIDIPVTLLTGIFDHDGTLIMDVRRIVLNYVHGFFGLDITIIGADWVGVIIEAAGSSAPPFLSNLAVLRALRISRFVRLMRLRKLKAKWQTIEDCIDNEWVLVCFSLFAKCCSIAGLNHYIGCIFFFIGKSEMPGYGTWLYDTPYPQFGNDRGETMADAPWPYQYLISLHWAITQFTPGSMHVQPQNILERVFAIWCLLFGLVVFSSFIASVTSARMQLAKMMSKFERDLWLLRKYCRQNAVSHSLTVRMKRYVDLVLVPKFHRMNDKDIVLLPQLSQDLREELQTELATKQLAHHPFFCQLELQSKHIWNKNVMKKLSNTALENLSLARGDTVFSCGEVAKDMVLALTNFLVYVPYVQAQDVAQIGAGHYVSEACLWTSWTRQGQLQASEEATAMRINADKFREVINKNGLVQAFAKGYATAFLAGMNAMLARSGMPSDVQESVTLEINIEKIALECKAQAACIDAEKKG